MQNARVYSYLRFSDPRQRAGSSIDRQTEYAHKWAAEHSLMLDETLSLRDEGLSAYHQRHVKKGALGVFLRAVEEGRVPEGSVLIVESLDRLSRAEPIIAQNQLTSIVLAGVRVVTASDNMEYSRESVKANPGILFMALGSMLKANLESEDKSKRVRKALYRQCKNWREGKWRGQLCAGKDPGWVEYSKAHNRFELKAREAESVRTMIRLFREGHGPQQIFDLMPEQGVPVPAFVSNSARLYALMKNRNIVGEKTVEVDGETFVLPGYYPPLLTDAELASLEYILAQRGRRPGKSGVVSIMTGIGILTCAHCKRAMANQNIMTRSRKENGLPQDGHRRLVCTGAMVTVDRCRAGSCSIVPVERALMEFCSDQMNLASLFVDNDERSHALGEALAFARQAVAETERKIQFHLDAAGSDASETPAAMKQHMRKLADCLKAEQIKVTECEHELESLHRHSLPAIAEVWADLREGVELLDDTARTRARQLVADTFRQIEVSLVDPGMIGMRLVSRRDIVRILWIDRKTGARLDQATLDNVAAPGIVEAPERLKYAA